MGLFPEHDNLVLAPNTSYNKQYAATVTDEVDGEADEDVLTAINEAAEEEDEYSSELESDSGKLPASSQKDQLKRITIQLPKSSLISPRSVFANFIPPCEIIKERQAVQSLLDASHSQKDDDFVEFELDNFSCYVDTAQYSSDMRSLHTHATSAGKELFFFDGILRVGDIQHYVQKVAFEQIPLGNYGKKESTVGDQLWIRSQLNQNKEIYYKLKSPSLEYVRFHAPFLWVADLAKHVVDFCTYLMEQERDVSIHYFKEEFGEWLKVTHKNSPDFQKWYKQRGSNDFRQSIVANSPFIRKEVWGMFRSQELRRFLIFNEVAEPFDVIKFQGKLSGGDEYPETIVTPYIYECFSHLESGQLLKPLGRSISTEQAIKLSWPEDRARDLAFIQEVDASCLSHEVMVSRIKPGDLISTPPDEKESGTQWKTEKVDKKWYGLVQKVHVIKNGKRNFDVIWLYQPDDTPCCSMKYPWENELFLSNHCTCGEVTGSKVQDNQVLGVHSVEWHGSPGTKAEFFVRQTYLSDERRFITLEKEHRRCSHDKKPPRRFEIGDTVLVLTPGRKFLEPCELLEYIDGQNGDLEVRLRKLRRRSDFAGNFSPNELIYTEEETCSSIHAIVTRCIVRFYSPNEVIPAPYSLDGVGNAFYITHRLLYDGQILPLGSDRPPLRQGFDPTKFEEKLRGLDLFSGFGNFGRGLGDGGAMAAKWANDIWNVATHSYIANAKDPQSVHPFLGSIDDMLRQALEGNFSDTVPRPGEVDVISGGSPCQGFSNITATKSTIRQKKNRSMVASFASCVDLWRPRWGILENVRTIVQSSKNRTEDCFSQLICALVGMGYQTQIILGDAWSHGSPQGRTRVFLYFAAPGLRLPRPPYPSHSNPRGRSSGSLGRMTNGESYIDRVDKPTAFKYTTLYGATADLPDIYDSRPDTCLAFPDHRLSLRITSGNSGRSRRGQILSLPMGPYGVNFSKAFYGINGGPQDMFLHEAKMFPLGTLRAEQISKGWGRQHPHQLCGTVTTVCHFTDARIGGGLVHWNQPRPLSIMEVRRAQGVPDDEILCGTPSDQWRQVGNAVARQVSVALGLALREAWVGTLYEVGDETIAINTANEERGIWGTGTRHAIKDDGVDELYTDAGNIALRPVTTTGDMNGHTDYSRSRSHTPGLGITSPFETDWSSSTPATSLPESQDDITAIKGADRKKRLLSRTLATGVVSSKRPRLAAKALEEEELDDPVLEEPPRSVTGATIVRLSSEELEVF